MTGRDRISELPDSVLTQILSYLPTKDSVRKSVLSKRWERLWLKVPGLDLELDDFSAYGKAFENFIEKFLDFNKESRMQKFKIFAHEESNINFSPDQFKEWTGFIVDHGIHHLDVEASRDIKMPQNIYTSYTLVSLTLIGVWMEDPKFVVSLPCLKIMHLEGVWYDDGSLVLEDLISGCPVLEDLTLFRPFDVWEHVETMMFLRVRSQTLKRFCLTFEYSWRVCTNFSVEIEAPRLEYLSFEDTQSDMIVVKNLTSLSTINITSDFNAKYKSPSDPENSRLRDIIRDFLTGVSSVRRMFIGSRTLEALYGFSNFRPIPKFENLYDLEAKLIRSMLQFLPVFLECCPNLKNLIVTLKRCDMTKLDLQLSNVPRCLSSTLEYVEIKKLIRGKEKETKLVDYFRENGAVLKKLSVSYKDSPMTMIDIYKN